MIEEIILEEEAIVEERAADGAWPGVGFLDRPIRSLPDLQSPIALSGESSVRRAIDTMNELAIATISHQAFTRHQNQRTRYSNPVPAPTWRITSKMSFAVSSR